MKLPELPVSPPEPTDEENARTERNWAREESVELIDRIVSNLDFLNHDGTRRRTQYELEELRDYLKRDMEE